MINIVISPFDPLYSSKKVKPKQSPKYKGKIDFHDYEINGEEFIDYEKYYHPLPEIPLYKCYNWCPLNNLYIEDEKSIKEAIINHHNPYAIEFLERKLPDFNGYSLFMPPFFALFDDKQDGE